MSTASLPSPAFMVPHCPLLSQSKLHWISIMTKPKIKFKLCCVFFFLNTWYKAKLHHTTLSLSFLSTGRKMLMGWDKKHFNYRGKYCLLVCEFYTLDQIKTIQFNSLCSLQSCLAYLVVLYNGKSKKVKGHASTSSLPKPKPSTHLL